MDEKEMIEEMAKLCCWFENRKCTANPGIDDVCDMFCQFGQACKKLMSEGYRKIPEGSVVLSNEEYNEMVEDFKQMEKDLKDIRDKTIKEVLDLADAHNNGFESDMEHFINHLKEIYKI